MKKQSVLAIGDSFLDHGVVEFPATVDPRMSESMYRLGKPIRPECELVTMTGGVWAVADYLRAITNDNVVVHCVPGEVPTTSWTDPSQIPARNFVDYRLRLDALE
jgi:hypothetical protein